MKLRALSVILVSQFVFVASCLADQKDTEVVEVSMVQLIAKPDSYVGRRVSVKGFVSLADEDSAIYLSVDNYRIFDYKNSIYLIGIDRQKFGYCEKDFCTISGVFRIMWNGATSSRAGFIEVDHVNQFRRRSVSE